MKPKKDEDLVWVPVKPDRKKQLDNLYGRKIIVGRAVYEFVWCQELSWSKGRLLGLHDPNKLRMYIVDYPGIESTILHEIGHAEFSASGLRQTSFWSPDLEEQVVELLSQSFTTSFRFKKYG